MIVFQNNETSAPVAPKSASFHKLENIKISNERKKTLRIENNCYENFFKCIWYAFITHMRI